MNKTKMWKRIPKILVVIIIVSLLISTYGIYQALFQANARVIKLTDQLADAELIDAELAVAELKATDATEALKVAHDQLALYRETIEKGRLRRANAVAAFSEQIETSHLVSVELGRSLEILIINNRNETSGPQREKLSAMQVRWYEHLEAEAMLHAILNGQLRAAVGH